MPFSHLNLHPDLQRGLKDLGFTRPTPIQADAILALCEHMLGDALRLRGFVGHGDPSRARAVAANGREILGEAFGSEPDHRIGAGENGLCRAVVLL